MQGTPGATNFDFIALGSSQFADKLFDAEDAASAVTLERQHTAFVPRDQHVCAAALRHGQQKVVKRVRRTVSSGSNFQPSESLKALVYFEDGDLQTLRRFDKDTLIAAVSKVRDLPVVALRSRQLLARHA